jgi:hypothetical protein
MLLRRSLPNSCHVNAPSPTMPAPQRTARVATACGVDGHLPIACTPTPCAQASGGQGGGAGGGFGRGLASGVAGCAGSGSDPSYPWNSAAASCNAVGGQQRVGNTWEESPHAAGNGGAMGGTGGFSGEGWSGDPRLSGSGGAGTAKGVAQGSCGNGEVFGGYRGFGGFVSGTSVGAIGSGVSGGGASCCGGGSCCPMGGFGTACGGTLGSNMTMPFGTPIGAASFPQQTARSMQMSPTNLQQLQQQQLQGQQFQQQQQQGQQQQQQQQHHQHPY